MALACIGIGSNLCQPADQVSRAIGLLAEIPKTSIDAHSSLYTTEPWGVEEQPSFCNAVAGVQTELSPLELLDKLQEIERVSGRVRYKKWGPRILDLDIIYYEQIAMDHPRLVLPHPYFSQREFVLAPLTELYPDLSISGKSCSDWLQQHRDKLAKAGK